MFKRILCAIMFLCGCAAPKPIPGVVVPPPGEVLTVIPGPMPGFGPFATVNDAIGAACPLILNKPHAVIPVRPQDQNFELYWRTAQEYCAWFYAPEGKNIEMSLFAVSAVQDDPRKRKCTLPAYVADSRYPQGSITYLTIIHNHPYDYGFSDDSDLVFLAQMALLHGFTPSVNDRQVSISIVAYIGRFVGGEVQCAGFYQYLPARNSELVKVVIDQDSGRWSERLIGHVMWENGLPTVVQ